MKRIEEYIMAAMLTITIIACAVVITLNFRPLYSWEITWQELDKVVGMSKEEVRENYDALIDYNSLWNTQEELVFPSFEMQESSIIHFQEVKQIFKIFYIVAIGGMILSTIGVYIQRKKKRYRYLKYTAIATASIPILVSIAILISWEKIFLLFHTLVFRNEYWLVNPEIEPYIHILPSAFFMHEAILIVSVILVMSGVCMILWRHSLKGAKLNKH